MSETSRTNTIVAGACPHCGAKLDAASSLADPPSPPLAVGDHSICLYCARLLVFTADGLRKPTAAETDELLQDVDVRAVLRAVRTVGPRDPGRRRERRR